MYVCPKHGFGHTNKVSTWNAHRKCDFCNTQISREYFGELAKRQWNNPRSNPNQFMLVSPVWTKTDKLAQISIGQSNVTHMLTENIWIDKFNQLSVSTWYIYKHTKMGLSKSESFYATHLLYGFITVYLTKSKLVHCIYLLCGHKPIDVTKYQLIRLSSIDYFTMCTPGESLWSWLSHVPTRIFIIGLSFDYARHMSNQDGLYNSKLWLWS